MKKNELDLYPAIFIVVAIALTASVYVMVGKSSRYNIFLKNWAV